MKSTRSILLLRPAAAAVLLAGAVLAQQWVRDASKSDIPKGAAASRIHGTRCVPNTVEVESSGTKPGGARMTG